MIRRILLLLCCLCVPGLACGQEIFDPGPMGTQNVQPTGSGGTGLSATPANGQTLIGNGTGYVLNTLTGTASQITVTNGAGTITLSLPATINATASTATALAADPTDCGAGTKATAIAANGNLTCSAVSLTVDVSGTLPVANGGTGVTASTGSTTLVLATSPTLITPTISGVLQLGTVAFASLPSPTNGMLIYCSDCTKATPCAGAGGGAFAKRIGGAWDCD